MSFHHWKEYFESNRDHFEDINRNAEDRLTAGEKKLITVSVQQFQRGESSEGKHLFAFAKTFPDPLYLDCIRLFICEEQMHARVLANFMSRYSIPCVKGHWVDTVFRKLRKLAGIENTIWILLVAEIISKVYYAALKKATGSEWLQKICTQVLKDEDQHISFQCYTLHLLIRERSSFDRTLIRTLYLLLMTGTITIVWLYHRPVLKRGGHSFLTFYQCVMTIYKSCETSILNKRIQRANAEILFP
jgi:hypothetical protein